MVYAVETCLSVDPSVTVICCISYCQQLASDQTGGWPAVAALS